MAPPADLDLSGIWRAAPAADEAFHRAYVDDDLDDDGWEPLAVPGHWRSSAAFADHDGPVLYRTRFTLDRDADHAPRSFLELDGVLAASDVWLDGTYLGDTSGYVVPHAFEVTDLLAARAEHLIAMEVSCAPVGAGRTRDLTGALGRSALMGEGHSAGGIWRPVRIHHTGPVRLRYRRLRCPDADERRAVLSLRTVLDTLEPRTVTLRTSVRPAVDERGRLLPDGDAPLVVERDHPLAAGENRVEWTLSVPRPELWWPHALGGQPLYDVTVDVLVDDEVSDTHRWRTGLRQVRLHDFVCRVNGERLFLKGVALGPTQVLLAAATPDEVEADVRLAVDAGADLARVHGHVARPELYDAADRAGLLLWQDLPVQWGMQRGAKGPARVLARAAVDRLAHHPSVAVWCAHHEPWIHDPGTERALAARGTRRRLARRVVDQVRPSWNRTVLDRSLALVLDKSDGSRPVITAAGVWPHPPVFSGTSSHLWAGWRWGDLDSLTRLLRWWPRVGRFVGEFGAQAPADAGALALGDTDEGDPGAGAEQSLRAEWPDLDWAAVARRTGLEVAAAHRVAAPDSLPDPTAWVAALQTHQAELVRSHVEQIRRLKYRPTGGFTAFALAEPVPGITAALLDHERRPKPSWSAFVAACAPVIAVIDRPPPVLQPGEHLHLDVHVVNDGRQDLRDVRVTATLTWTMTDRAASDPGRGPEPMVDRQGWTGDVAADGVARVGEVHLEAPTGATALTLDLRLDGPHGLVGHRRHQRSVAPAHP